MSEEVAAPVEPEASAAATPAPEAAAAPPRRRRWPWLTALVLAFALFTTAGAYVGATVSYAESLQGRLLPGTMIAGVDVGGLTTDEALVRVRGTLDAELDRRIVLRWRDQRWATTARALGARTNARRIVRDVARSQTGLTWQDWARLRWMGERADVAAAVHVAYGRPAVARFVARAAREVAAKPVDATLEVAGTGIEITPSQVGYRARPQSAVTQILRALRGSRRNTPVRLAVETVNPDVSEKQYAEVLLLDQSDHKLTLFEDGEAIRSWIVATGTGDYPTPLGQYSVTEKRYLPTWINPDPEGWGKDMPEEIGPGPNNPLGLRALNWSAPGAIRFHGTQAIDSLGTDASHGCVRMANADVIELYDLVEVGAVIVSQS